MSDERSNPANPAPILSREERLAAKLRENLRRRKAQARDIDAQTPGDPGALSKPSGKS